MSADGYAVVIAVAAFGLALLLLALCLPRYEKKHRP